MNPGLYGAFVGRRKTVALGAIFESPDTGTLALSTNYNWAHGLGFRPKLWQVGLRCTVTDGNYTAGTELTNIGLNTTAGRVPLVGFVSLTLIQFYGPDIGYEAPNGAFTGILTLTVANWRPFARIFA